MALPALSPTPATTPVHVYVAARSRVHGPTAPLWHAVRLHRPAGEIVGACELTVCGTLVRIAADVSWPTGARDVCPACVTLAR
jgi:hypothetical protein